MLPKKRQKSRSGIERAPPREWLRHRKFVRSHGCCVLGCMGTPIEFAHVRSAANSGTALKPHDAFGISLCSFHHGQQHRIGQPAFQSLYGLDLAKLAAEFTRRSPDIAMRESLKLVEPSDA